MKKNLTFFIAVIFITSLVNASTFVSNAPDDSFSSVTLTINDVYKMKAGDLKTVLGFKLNLKERLAFILFKKKLKKEIKRGKGDKNIYSVLPVMLDDEKRKFRWGGFLLSFLPAVLGTFIGGPFLGLLFGLMGVGYVHWLKKNKNKEYNRASWVGLGVWAVFIIMIAALILASFDFSFGG